MVVLARIFLFLILATCQTALSAFTWAPANQFSIGVSVNVHIGADANGNAMAIWSQNDGFTTVVNTSYFTAGAWGPAVTISSPPDSNFPVIPTDVAMDASGTALAVWSAPDIADVEAAVFNGSTWSAPIILDATAPDAPVVAMDGTGKGIAGWTSTNAKVALYDGTSWGPATVIPAIAAGAPSVSISPMGTALFVWEEISTFTIFANFYDGTSWGPSTPISTGAFNIIPDVGMAADGTGIAVWRSGNDIVAAFFDGSTWSAPAIISTGTGNENVHIDVQPNGHAVAVWIDGTGNIAAALFDGSVWAAPTTISTGGNASNPEVAMDGSGNAMAVWSDNSGPPDLVQSALLSSALGNVWSPQTLVKSDPFFTDSTDVAFSQSGRAFAVWMEFPSELEAETFGSFTDAIIPPPSNFIGHTCKDHFAWQTDCVHLLSWTPADSSVVAGYILRRNGMVIAQIPATGPFAYQDHNRCKKTDVYALTSVDAFGVESVAVFVTLN